MTFSLLASVLLPLASCASQGTTTGGPVWSYPAGFGVVPPSGIATRALDLANDPALGGRTTYFQGLATGPRTLSRDWIQLTILP